MIGHMGYDKKYRDAWEKSVDRPKAKCHPERPHRARGLCPACYDRWLYANSPKSRATKLKNAVKWKSENGEKIKARQRANHLRKRYGIDEISYQKMLEEQEGKCALCLGKVKLHIDHCHDTGVVRGLLCLRCNGSLAWIEEMLRQQSTPWFAKAMRYIENAGTDTKTKK